MQQQDALKSEIIREFEAQRRVTLLRQRAQQVVVLIGFSALIAVCFHVSGFFSGSQGSDPWGRIANLLDIMFPDLKPEALFEDRATAGSLCSWFYDMPTWLDLLWETVQIAIVATLFGIFGGFWASLLASKNLSPSPYIYWLKAHAGSHPYPAGFDCGVDLGGGLWRRPIAGCDSYCLGDYGKSRKTLF